MLADFHWCCIDEAREQMIEEGRNVLNIRTEDISERKGPTMLKMVEEQGLKSHVVPLDDDVFSH